MVKATIKNLDYNARFSVIHTDHEDYLVDLDKFWVRKFFPILIIFLPYKGMKLTEEVPSYFFFKEIKEKRNTTREILLIIATAVFSPLINFIVGFLDIKISILWTYIFLFLSIVLIIGYRLYLSRKGIGELPSSVRLEELHYYKFRINVFVVGNVVGYKFFGRIFLHFVGTLLLIAAYLGFIYSGNFIALGIGMILLFGALSFDLAFVLRDTEFQIKILDEK